MNECRVFIAVLIFCVSSYLVYDLFAHGFNWTVLFFCIGGYVTVHYVWPKNYEKGEVVEWLEFIVDFPFRIFALLLRSVGRLVKSGDGDVGVDL